MISYRSFRNHDTPQLIEVWRSQPRARGLAQPVSVELFEQLVLAKPYFENEGLIVAFDGRTAVGFVHAGFGATDNAESLNRRFGVTSLLLVRPESQQSAVGPDLLARSEEYLRSRGAGVLYAGGIRPLDPFYRGLYGGSEMPGVLASDSFANGLYRAHGYREIDRVVMLERELASFRPPIDRAQMQIRRTSIVEEVSDALPRNWWEACALEHFQVIAFHLCERNESCPVATARFWLLETFAAGWGVQAAGLFELEVASDHRRRGLATFLLGDAVRRLAAQGIGLVEVATMAGNAAARALYEKLGFREVDQGIAYRKEGPAV
ncbi:MAG TPA: GNAT family N-acetyltransferase [Pirellulales bacterium]|nr:GNAT family N-acetyltransferase [Pirellulales bacterium]